MEETVTGTGRSFQKSAWALPGVCVLYRKREKSPGLGSSVELGERLPVGEEKKGEKKRGVVISQGGGRKVSEENPRAKGREKRWTFPYGGEG